MTTLANKVDWTERFFRCSCAAGDDNEFLQDNIAQMPCESRCYVQLDEDGNLKPCYGEERRLKPCYGEDGNMKPCSGEDAGDSDVPFENVSLDDLIGPAELRPPTGGLRAPAPNLERGLDEIRKRSELGAPTGGLRAPDPNLERGLDELKKRSGDIFERLGVKVTHLNEEHYSINDRSVRLLMMSGSAGTLHLQLDHYPDEFADMKNIIFVNDGPMWQPLVDYVLQTDANEFYDFHGTQNPVEVVGAARDMSFEPLVNIEDRVSAMRFATAEASIRINAANQEKTYRLRQKVLTGPSRYNAQVIRFASQGGA
jgi:hypothetical protein